MSGGSQIGALKSYSKIDRKLDVERDILVAHVGQIQQEILKNEKIEVVQKSTDVTRLMDLAQTYQKLQWWGFSEALLLRVIELLEKSDKKIEYFRAAVALAEGYYASNSFDEAGVWVKRANEISTNSSEIQESEKQNALVLQAKILYKTNRVSEADSIYADLRKHRSK